MKQYIIVAIPLLTALTCTIAGATTYTCADCSDCNAKIQSADYGDVVMLTADITNHDGNCITFGGADGVTFDCGGHTIKGDGDTSGTGVDLSDNSDDNIIRNVTISRFYRGIRIDHSTNNTMTDIVSKDNRGRGVCLIYADQNNLINVLALDNAGSGNIYGFYMGNSDHNTLTNVTASGNKGSSVAFGGFYLQYSNYNNFTDLIASDNSKYGIHIYWNSNHNRFRNATITTRDGQGGLYAYSHIGQSIHNDIDTSNMINGKPIQFFDDYYKPCPDNQVLDYNDTYSLIHFYNGNNITLYATTLEDSLFLWSTDNSKVYNVNASHGREGIRVWRSSLNTFKNITASHNLNSGIYIDSSSDSNNFINVTATHNSDGIYANTANDGVFTDITVKNNSDDAIHLRHCDDNSIDNATILDNGGDGISFVYNSERNTVNNSRIEYNSGVGLKFIESGSSDPEYNLIYNNILNNTVNIGLEDGISNPNHLNATKTTGPNIVGGLEIGGNFWAEPDGTGYSQTCADTDEDGICDECYDLSNGASVATDWLPLAGNNTSLDFTPCGSCADCSQKIATASAGEVVRLVVDIDCEDGDCIDFGGADGVIFDCGGHTIMGDGDSDGYGIRMNGAENSTVRNGPGISGFQRGIYLENARNNTFTELTVRDNQEGLRLSGDSTNNTVAELRIENNTDYGIYLNASGANYPRYNRFYDNFLNNTCNLHFNDANNENYWNTTLNCSAASTNAIDRICIGGNYWADPDGAGHSEGCVDSDQNGICDDPYTAQPNNSDYLPLTGDLAIKDCTSCSDCSEKLAAVADGGTVRLATDIFDQDCDCILISRSNVTFDGENHLIDGDGDWDGWGIHLDASSYGDLRDVTIRDCRVMQFDDGIYFDGTSVNTVEDSLVANVTLSDNAGHGIYLSHAHRNHLKDTESNSNHNDGIMIWDSSHNLLENFEVISNGQCGIYIIPSSSPYNNLTNITASFNSFAGIYLDRCAHTTINDSRITENSIVGITLGSSGANLIYNNYFCNDDNANIGGTILTNHWNVTNRTGPNIVEKPFIGGNYWSGYRGLDNNSDGFGDTPYNVNGTGESNIDYLPLFDPPDIRIDPTTLDFKSAPDIGGKVGGGKMLMQPPRSQPDVPVDRILVDGRPPDVLMASAAELPKAEPAAGTNILPNVPAFNWCYGCSATAAAMLAGYYDNNGYPDMYTGPANGGVCPLTNSVWGAGECPISATHQEIDGRTVRGHVEDYWVSSGMKGTDPYVINGWGQHTWRDCTADFMGTSQDKFGAAYGGTSDGGTWFWFNSYGEPLYDYYEGTGEHDGCYGLRRFVESRGYAVLENFNQYIRGYKSDTVGFTFENFTSEIDSGRPVIIQVAGHSMLGFGYNNSTGQETVYLHDTWDHSSSHIMTWGGSYSGLQHYGVTVMRLAPADHPVQAGVFSIIEDAGKPLAIDSITKNESWMPLDHPDTPFSMVEYGQRAVIVRVNGTEVASGDSDIIMIGSNDLDESPYPGGVTVAVWECGDVDDSGIVNILDVRLLMNHVADPDGYPVALCAGDLDSDGDIDEVDVGLLLNHIFNPAV